MRFLFYTLVGIVCVFLMAATFLFVAAPTDYVSDRVIAMVKEKTGRDLAVNGGASFSFYPSIGVKLKNVTLSGPPEMAREQFVTMAALEIKVPIVPLFRRRIEVERFVLVRPVISLRSDRQGRKSWDFSRAGTPAPAAGGDGANPNLSPDLQEFIRNSSTAEQTSAPAPAGPAAPATGAIEGLSLGDVRIVDGRVNYIDDAAGTNETLEQVNATLSLPELEKALSLEGQARWHGQDVPFSVRIASLQDILEGRMSQVVLALNPALLKVDFRGDLTAGKRISARGPLKIKSPSLIRLAAWTGTKMSDAPGFGAMVLSGKLDARGDVVAIKAAKFSLAGTDGSGEVTLRTGGKRPRINARLALRAIKLDDFIAPSGATPKSSSAGRKAKPEAGAGQSDAIANLLRGGATPKQTGTARGANGAARTAGDGWSSQPMNFAALRKVDVDARLRLGAFRYGKIKVGRSDAVVKLQNGLLNGRFDRVALYGGQGTASLVVNARKAVPNLKVVLKVNGVRALPLLKDAADFDWIAGTASIALDLTGRGLSQRRIVATLGGMGRFAFADGAIVGINIPQMVRGLQNGQFSGWQRRDTLRTDFTSLTGSMVVANGIASNRDLSLVGPLLRLTGEGTVSLPPRTLDYIARPKLVASLEGQGGANGLGGLEVPVRIKGPWSNPSIAPDLTAVLKDPTAALKSVKGIAKNFTKSTGTLKKTLQGLKKNKLDAGSVKKIFDGLFGSQSGG